MSTSSAVFRRGTAVMLAVVAATVFAISPVSAADSAPAPKPAKVAKQKKTAAAPTAAARPPKAAAAPKPAKPAKPAPPPEPSYAERRKADGPWAKGANWMMFRAGYAKSSQTNAGDGLAGYGIAYQHMIGSKYAFGASVQHDLLNHFVHSYEISVPFTAEFTRHFKWNTALRPYVGAGAGYYFHKYYRTDGDYTGAPRVGEYITVGANMPLNDRHILGLDVRTSFTKGREGVVNPVFGHEKTSETLWSVKLGWGLVY